MDSMEAIEELKKKLINRIQYSKEKPEEVINIIKKELQELQIRYEELCGKDPRIAQYIEEKTKELEVYAVKQTGKKKGLQLNDIRYITRRMSKRLDEIKDEKSERIEDEQNKKNIENLTRNNKAVSRDFLQVFEDSLRNIKSMANRNLAARQFEQRKIEQINEQITYYIRSAKSKNEMRIYESFLNSDKKIVNDLISIYDEYVKNREKIKEENREKETKSQREKFVNSVDSKIPLDEQKKHTDEVLAKIEKENKDVKENEGRLEALPRDIII